MLWKQINGVEQRVKEGQLNLVTEFPLIKYIEAWTLLNPFTLYAKWIVAL